MCKSETHSSSYDPIGGLELCLNVHTKCLCISSASCTPAGDRQRIRTALYAGKPLVQIHRDWCRDLRHLAASRESTWSIMMPDAVIEGVAGALLLLYSLGVLSCL